MTVESVIAGSVRTPSQKRKHRSKSNLSNNGIEFAAVSPVAANMPTAVSQNDIKVLADGSPHHKDKMKSATYRRQRREEKEYRKRVEKELLDRQEAERALLEKQRQRSRSVVIDHAISYCGDKGNTIPSDKSEVEASVPVVPSGGSKRERRQRSASGSRLLNTTPINGTNTTTNSAKPKLTATLSKPEVSVGFNAEKGSISGKNSSNDRNDDPLPMAYSLQSLSLSDDEDDENNDNRSKKYVLADAAGCVTACKITNSIDSHFSSTPTSTIAPAEKAAGESATTTTTTASSTITTSSTDITTYPTTTQKSSSLPSVSTVDINVEDEMNAVVLLNRTTSSGNKRTAFCSGSMSPVEIQETSEKLRVSTNQFHSDQSLIKEKRDKSYTQLCESLSKAIDNNNMKKLSPANSIHADSNNARPEYQSDSSAQQHHNRAALVTIPSASLTGDDNTVPMNGVPGGVDKRDKDKVEKESETKMEKEIEFQRKPENRNSIENVNSTKDSKEQLHLQQQQQSRQQQQLDPQDDGIESRQVDDSVLENLVEIMISSSKTSLATDAALTTTTGPTILSVLTTTTTPNMANSSLVSSDDNEAIKDQIPTMQTNVNPSEDEVKKDYSPYPLPTTRHLVRSPPPERHHGLGYFTLNSVVGNRLLLSFFLSFKNINTVGGDDLQTPLHKAMYWGYSKSVQHLVENDADIWARDRNGRTPLMISAATGGVVDLKLMRYLVSQVRNDEIANYINIVDNSGNSLAHYSCLNSYNGALQFFIHYGGNINLKNKQGKGCLQMATENAQFDVFRTLVEENGGREYALKNLDSILKVKE